MFQITRLNIWAGFASIGLVLLLTGCNASSSTSTGDSFVTSDVESEATKSVFIVDSRHNVSPDVVESAAARSGVTLDADHVDCFAGMLTSDQLASGYFENSRTFFDESEDVRYQCAGTPTVAASGSE